MEYKLREDGTQSRRLSWLQATEGSSKRIRLKGFGDTVTLRCWNLPEVGQLLVDEPGGLAAAGLVCAPFLTSCEAMEFAETGHRREERPGLPVSLLIVLHALRLECEKPLRIE